jgi:4-hydroxythreonine-4-phosphate dehydrogenase
MAVKKIAITMGDPAGIGAEIINKAWSRLTDKEKHALLVIGSRSVLDKAAYGQRTNQDISLVDIDNAAGISFGEESASSGKAALDYLNQAIKMLKAKELLGVVTCPVSKFAISRVEKGFKGQTEYLGTCDGAKQVGMMLLSGNVRFSLATTHKSLKEACQILNSEIILETIILTAQGLQNFFGIKNPGISVAALNPHLGESGLLGNEEKEIIRPAVSQAQKELPGCVISGPESLESIVERLRGGHIDAGICLYHDQAIVPLKILFPHRGVNLTLGLSYVRTSSLHGTAFDIAGKNKADCSSLLDAIRLALALCLRKQ